MPKLLNEMNEICANCGLLYGSHHGGTSPWPYNYCPGHEGQMDWENGPGTIFKPSGQYRDRDYDRAAQNGGHSDAKTSM